MTRHLRVSREDFLRARAARKRASVLEAARHLFAEQGLEGAGMERIAHDAQVSTATLYRLFPSKLTLFEAVLRESVAGFHAALEGQPVTHPKERLTALATAYARLLHDPVTIGLLRAMFGAAKGAPEVSALFYETVKSAIGGAFHNAAQDAIEAGILFSPDPLAPGDLLLGIIEHVSLWTRLVSNEAPNRTPEDIAARALHALWAAFGPRG